MIGFKIWLMILLLSPLFHTLGVNGCGVIEPTSILKTIENEEDGETIHCVDIYKQPAFSHPELRNHTIQMKPSSDPFEQKSQRTFYSNNSSGLYLQNWHRKGEVCPEGTIPILQSSSEDFPQKTSHPLGDGQKEKDTKEYAVAFFPQLNVHGVSQDINLWNPKVRWPTEYSSAQVWVTDGGGRDINTVEAGWLVTSDSHTPLLFIYWTTDGYVSTGCYNLCCGGFVQTSKKILLGGKITPISQYGGTQRQISIQITREDKTGNWWLTYMGIHVGYWPPSIFRGGLKSSASLVEWGGEVLTATPSITGSHTTTQMGSGHFSREGFGKAALFKQLTYLTAEGDIKDATSIEGRAKRPQCYDIAVQKFDTNYGVYFYYGGPGFSSFCQDP